MTTNIHSCSSKRGPFCPLAGHRRLQKHQMTKVPADMMGIYNTLLFLEEGFVSTLESIERGNNNIFFIRHQFLNIY